MFDGHQERTVADFAAAALHHNLLEEIAEMMQGHVGVSEVGTGGVGEGGEKAGEKGVAEKSVSQSVSHQVDQGH